MDKNEFLEHLADRLSDIGTVEQDDPPYNLMVSTPAGEIFRLQVTASRASSTKSTALQAGNVVHYIREHPNADSKEVAAQCGVSPAYADILIQSLTAEVEVEDEGVGAGARRSGKRST